jgi:hypothetical protein
LCSASDRMHYPDPTVYVILILPIAPSETNHQI